MLSCAGSHLSHDTPDPAYVARIWVSNLKLWDSCLSMKGRADIERSERQRRFERFIIRRTFSVTISLIERNRLATQKSVCGMYSNTDDRTAAHSSSPRRSGLRLKPRMNPNNKCSGYSGCSDHHAHALQSYTARNAES